nr:MAG TPA: D12 class N6 adenine-specific DNA methyltransferase [Caudoviricetes sp.]
MANQAKRNFKQAPLPFVGQKRNFLNHFKAILNEQIPGDGEGWTIVDTFGGSGLLSHTAKQLKPRARVIYNDFDGYAERIKHIDDINRLRAQIAALLVDVPRQKRITDKALKAQIIDIIKAFDGYVDLATLTSWLLFSGQQVGTFEELCPRTFGIVYASQTTHLQTVIWTAWRWSQSRFIHYYHASQPTRGRYLF